MPPIEKVSIRQTVVIWDASTRNQYGELSVSNPREITVEAPIREDEAREPDNEGRTKTSEIVSDEYLTIGSIIWIGTLLELPTGTADDPSPLYRVVGRAKQPDIKGRNFRYTATLMYHGNTLPPVV